METQSLLHLAFRDFVESLTAQTLLVAIINRDCFFNKIFASVEVFISLGGVGLRLSHLEVVASKHVVGSDALLFVVKEVAPVSAFIKRNGAKGFLK